MLLPSSTLWFLTFAVCIQFLLKWRYKGVKNFYPCGISFSGNQVVPYNQITDKLLVKQIFLTEFVRRIWNWGMLTTHFLLQILVLGIRGSGDVIEAELWEFLHGLQLARRKCTMTLVILKLNVIQGLLISCSGLSYNSDYSCLWSYMIDLSSIAFFQLQNQICIGKLIAMSSHLFYLLVIVKRNFSRKSNYSRDVFAIITILLVACFSSSRKTIAGSPHFASSIF